MRNVPRLFVILLYLYPASFRHRFGHEMSTTFHRTLQQHDRAHTRFALWIRTIRDAILCAVVEWRDLIRNKWPSRNPTQPPRSNPRRRSGALSSIGRDCRLAIRTLVRRPGFTAAAVATLALGIGANTAVFSVVDGVMWRSLGYDEPDRLVAVWPGRSMSMREIAFLHDNAESFASVASVAGWTMALSGVASPTQVYGARTSANLFTTLGTPAQLGRVFRRDDGFADARPVVILSDRLWKNRYGADEAVVGRSLLIDGDPHDVVGVMPASFEIMNPTMALWVPLREDVSHWTYTAGVSRVIARLAPGVTSALAGQEFVSLLDRMRLMFGYSENYGRDASIRDLKDYLVGGYRTMFWVLLGAVGFILLIAGSNLSNLILVKAGGRRQEMAIRTALGATRGTLIQVVVAEAAVLSVLGGLLGMTIAYGGIELLQRIVPADTPRVANIVVDGRVLAMCFVFALGTGLVFSLVPAAAATKLNLRRAIGVSRIDGSVGATQFRLRSIWVSCQIALAVMLVVGAGLMVRTMKELAAVDPGFSPAGVLTLRLQPAGESYDTPAEYRLFYDELLSHISALPMVSDVGAVQHLPFSGWTWGIPFELVEAPLNEDETRPVAGWRIVAGDYIKTMRIRMREGRVFNDADTEGAEQVAIINRTLAEVFWADASPIGRRMRLGRNRETTVTVVGVIDDVLHVGADRDPGLEIYRPLNQSTMSALMLAIRSSADLKQVGRRVQDVIWAVDSDVPISHVMPYEDLIASTFGQSRLIMILLTIFAAVALVLGAIGVYGVTSFTVIRRSNEIGLRMALGATERRVRSEVLKQGMASALLGTFFGLVGAGLLARFMAGLVFAISPVDPVTFAGVAGVMLMVAFAASLIPAWRATRIDPALTLKNQ